MHMANLLQQRQWDGKNKTLPQQGLCNWSAAGAPRVAHTAPGTVPHSSSSGSVYYSCKGPAIYLAATEEHRPIPSHFCVAKQRASADFCALLYPKSKSQWSFWKWWCRAFSFLTIWAYSFCLTYYSSPTQTILQFGTCNILLWIVFSKQDCWFHLWALN